MTPATRPRTAPPRIDPRLRAGILADPDAVLDDDDLMRVLVEANDRARGANVVDLRAIAMDRLAQRLDRLEDTHRSVIAAAYDNLAGTNMIHRAALRMLDAERFEAFLEDLAGPVADILRVESLCLVLEGAEPVRRGALLVERPGFVDAYLAAPRGAPRAVTLRQVRPDDGRVHGERAPDIRSESCLRLDLGDGVRPGLLVMGAEDPHQFSPQQGTDLLAFLGGVAERAMRRWLRP